MSLYKLLHGENPIGAALLACFNLTTEESRGQQTLAFERVKYGKVQHESQQTPASGDTS